MFFQDFQRFWQVCTTLYKIVQHQTMCTILYNVMWKVVTPYQFEQPVSNSFNHKITCTVLYGRVQFSSGFCVIGRVVNRLLKLVRSYNLLILVEQARFQSLSKPLWKIAQFCVVAVVVISKNWNLCAMVWSLYCMADALSW